MEKVFRWQALIDSGKFSNVHELARVIGKDDGYVSLIIRLAAGEILPLFYSLFKSRLDLQSENQNHFGE